MERIKISDHLYLDEIVDVKTYAKYAEDKTLYKLVYQIDANLIGAFEFLRNEIGHPATVNNWWNTFVKNKFDADKTYKEVEAHKSLFQWSGLRPAYSPYWSPNSMHSYFKALDIKFFDVELNHKAQELIKKNWDILGIGGLEIKDGWTHIDTAYRLKGEGLRIF